MPRCCRLRAAPLAAASSTHLTPFRLYAGLSLRRERQRGVTSPSGCAANALSLAAFLPPAARARAHPASPCRWCMLATRLRAAARRAREDGTGEEGTAARHGMPLLCLWPAIFSYRLPISPVSPPLFPACGGLFSRRLAYLPRRHRLLFGCLSLGCHGLACGKRRTLGRGGLSMRACRRALLRQHVAKARPARNLVSRMSVTSPCLPQAAMRAERMAHREASASLQLLACSISCRRTYICLWLCVA